MFKNKNFRRPMSSSSSSSPSTTTSTTTATNPSFSGLLTNVKNTKNTPHGPEQYAQIKDKIKVFDAKSFLLPPCSFVDGAVPPPPKQNYVRLCCISDTHNAHDVLTKLLPPADPENMILVHAGDFTDVGKPKDIEKFCKWLVEIRPRFKATVVIAGNHDISLDEEFYNSEDNWQRFGHEEKCDSKAMKLMLKNSCTHYLENESAEIAGLKFYGSPYSPWFYDWAFNRNRHLQCHNDWQQIPTDTDVLITHGPPLGHNDQCVPSMEHFGDADLLDWIEEYKPMLSISGHLHESYGATTNGNTVFLNASSLNVKYDFTRPNMPMVIDVPVGKEEK